MVSFKDGFTQSHKQQIVIALVGDVGDVGFYVYRGLEDCSDFLLHQTGFLKNRRKSLAFEFFGL
jgi:hypothetical protein